jgi:hypothetical protein
VTFFPKIFSRIFAFWAVFKGFKDIIFGKIKMSHHMGGPGGGTKISQKSVTYYLNGP